MMHGHEIFLIDIGRKQEGEKEENLRPKKNYLTLFYKPALSTK